MSNISGIDRIGACFSQLKEKGKKAAFVTFTMANDPDYQTSLDLLCSLPGAGADIIELGMPFSDPMADGPAIQLAGERALRAGSSLHDVFGMVGKFREVHPAVPLILMGYYNPIFHYGVQRFAEMAREKGVDGLLIVDLPPEEDDEVYTALQDVNLALIKLATPTTDVDRLRIIASKASGFLYYVSVAGVTGVKSAEQSSIATAVEQLKEEVDLPIVVGFGVKTKEQVSDIGNIADGVVVGSTLVSMIAESLDQGEEATPRVLEVTRELSSGLME